MWRCACDVALSALGQSARATGPRALQHWRADPRYKSARSMKPSQESGVPLGKKCERNRSTAHGQTDGQDLSVLRAVPVYHSKTELVWHLGHRAHPVRPFFGLGRRRSGETATQCLDRSCRSWRELLFFLCELINYQ